MTAVAAVSMRKVRRSEGACQELAQLSCRDTLTGLPNRAALPDELQRGLNTARHSSVQVAAIFADLDRFKLVNDAYGHEVGDRLMGKVAKRMAAVASES